MGKIQYLGTRCGYRNSYTGRSHFPERCSGKIQQSSTYVWVVGLHEIFVPSSTRVFSTADMCYFFNQRKNLTILLSDLSFLPLSILISAGEYSANIYMCFSLGKKKSHCFKQDSKCSGALQPL